MPEKLSIFELLNIFKQDRPEMAKQDEDPQFLLNFLLEEVDELVNPPEKLDMQLDVYQMQELADIIIIAISLIKSLGGDPETVIREKVGRNILKYPAFMFDGTIPYDRAIRKAKRMWVRKDKKAFWK